MNRHRLAFFCALAAFLFASTGVGRAQTWVLLWSDEFDGAANSQPDPTKWGYDIGGNGWGNNELEYYTNRPQNAFLDGQGNLVIQTIKEKYTGPDNVSRDYTSARLLTLNKFSVKYGKIEARIKLPLGQGIWPAFWMLGANIATTGWPTCGEVDIMENVGREPSINHGTLHGPGYSGSGGLSASYPLPGGARFADDFHTFAIEWAPSVVRFYVDGNLYETRTPADIPPTATWVYDHPFFVLLDVAVGGNFPGNPDSTSTFPQTMLVDYVRVYTDSSVDYSTPVITGATIRGKDLVVTGNYFDSSAVILLNGNQQRTLRDPQDLSTLTGKKVGKKIKGLDPGQSASIQVANSDGALSPVFPVPKP